MTTPTAPYSADTLSRGWRFEVDMETFKRSDTWKKARTGALRGALLLLWAEAWQEKPCGTLPDDDELIALMIDMPSATFEKNRAVLLRGWSKCDDGRLYHDVITTRVLAMLDKRANDAQRAAARRARNAESATSPSEVTGASRVTHNGVGPEFDTKHQAPSTENQAPKGKEKPPAEPWVLVDALMADGLSEEVAKAWLAHRRTRKAKLTALAWNGFKAEVVKAGWQIEAAVLKAIARNWTAFEAGWVKDIPAPAKGRMTDDERAAENARTTEAARRQLFGSQETLDA